MDQNNTEKLPFAKFKKLGLSFDFLRGNFTIYNTKNEMKMIAAYGRRGVFVFSTLQTDD